MMKKSIRVFSVLLGAFAAMALFGCAPEKAPDVGTLDPDGDPTVDVGKPDPDGDPIEDKKEATLLSASAEVAPVSRSEINAREFSEFRSSTELFSVAVSEEAFSRAEKTGNFVLSPVSIYTALATASACAAGNTKQELLSVLHTTSADLEANFSVYYRMFGAMREDAQTGYAQLANSIWVDDAYATHVRDQSLKKLAENYYCDAFSADFLLNNAGANQAIRDFVKDKTKGLIDQNFDLGDQTVFALVNTLYLKDVWLPDGGELALDPAATHFRNADGKTVMAPFMQTPYHAGVAAQGDGFTYFRAATQHGYTLKVLLPDDGKTVEEIFTAENLARVNGTKDYGGYDVETETRFQTRLILPVFEADSDLDLIKTLKALGVHELFDPARCDNSTLLEGLQAYCNEVRHIAKLKVDRKGVEGAAVTVMGEAGAAPPVDVVYADFVVDRPFGFLLTDAYGNVLFSGVVRSL